MKDRARRLARTNRTENQQKQLSSQSHRTCLDEQKEDNGSEPATTTLQQKTSDHMEYLPSPKYP